MYKHDETGKFGREAIEYSTAPLLPRGDDDPCLRWGLVLMQEERSIRGRVVSADDSRCDTGLRRSPFIGVRDTYRYFVSLIRWLLRFGSAAFADSVGRWSTSGCTQVVLFPSHTHGRSSLPERGHLPRQYGWSLRGLTGDSQIDSIMSNCKSFGASIVKSKAIRRTHP